MSDEPLQLNAVQQALLDEFVRHDSGLFVLNTVPGSGKSTERDSLGSDDVLRRYVAGDKTPELRTAVISFNRDEATSIVSGICDRLKQLVEHELTPEAAKISDAELNQLVRCVRRSPFIGTIDGFLRGVFEEIASDVDFEEPPSVGNDPKLKQVHAKCYEALRTKHRQTQRLERLETAYPDETYEAGVADLLVQALSYCRERQLSTPEFQAALERTVDAVYAEGRPESFDGVVAAIHRCVGNDASDTPCPDLDGEQRRRVTTADKTLYDEWEARLKDFCAVLTAYREAYRKRIRTEAAVSHLDVAYIVDGYFDGEFDDVDDGLRTRVQDQYTTRLESLIIDEAQDVSKIQHSALSHLITPDMQVCCLGDSLQGIYGWRHADLDVFEAATTDGTYLGIDWDVHETWTATTTYRCVPEVAAAINEIAEPVLTDPARGDMGDLDVTYHKIEAARERTDETNVHIASFDAYGDDPDSYPWVNPPGHRGEATKVAKLLATGLADGTFTDETGSPLDITVLFRSRKMMAEYEAAFNDEGLRVRNASQNLFACPVVRAVFDVYNWLVNPTDADCVASLIKDSELGLDSLHSALESHDWDLDAVIESHDLTDAQRFILTGLRDLREKRDAFFFRPANANIEAVIEALALRADPHARFPDIDPEQRVANLDALSETLAQWTDENHLTLGDVTDLVEPFLDAPGEGPTQPNTDTTGYDVKFTTCHSSKGSEEDVIVIANPGFSIWSRGPYSHRFIARSDIAGLAPPTNTSVPTDIDLPPFAGGLYNPADSNRTDRDVGLRWATEHWSDTVAASADRSTLVGPKHLQRAAALERAEAARLLYVALTRARDHLVVPLPDTLPDDGRPRDRWLDMIRDGLQFTDDRSDSYQLTPATGPPIDIGVNDPALTQRTPPSQQRVADVATTPPQRSQLASWIPRTWYPSTAYQLTQDPASNAVPHLLGQAIHTETNDVPDDLPLPFDRLGPDDVGTCFHTVLTRLIQHDLPEHVLQSRGKPVQKILDTTLDEYAPLPDHERKQLRAFFQEEVLDEFLTSELWTRIQRAETVQLEKIAEGSVSIHGVEVEIHGKADIVITLPSGKRYVTDMKIALTEPTDETKCRYKLQVEMYAHLFQQQAPSPTTVSPTIEVFGVTRNTIHSNLPSKTVTHRLKRVVAR